MCDHGRKANTISTSCGILRLPPAIIGMTMASAQEAGVFPTSLILTWLYLFHLLTLKACRYRKAKLMRL